MKAFLKKHKFGFTLLFALIIGGLVISLTGGCLVYRIFHIECLTCGMTHACFEAMRFNFRRAFMLHPMFWSMPILALYVIFEGRLFKKKKYDIILLSFLLLGFIVQYILKYKGIIVT